MLFRSTRRGHLMPAEELATAGTMIPSHAVDPIGVVRRTDELDTPPAVEPEGDA